MHIIKPQALGLSFRPVEFKGRCALSISAYLHLPFAQQPGGTLWSEQSMWEFLATEMSPPLIDEGILKPVPEFLVHGHAFTTPERRQAVAVRVRLGACEKTLWVFGNRAWAGGRPTDPQPFERLPLTWDYAYGGPDFSANPVGRGRQRSDGVQWLPNIELPSALLRGPQDEVVPAGFGRLDVLHPQRAALRGTYDEAWLKQHSPGFPPDLDWRHFNLAPKDQWLDSLLQGDEVFELDHLHPTQPRIQGRLPGLGVRVLANYRNGTAPAPRLKDVATRLTTVWFFPHRERAVLIYQGLAQTDEDDGSDVRHLIAAVERSGDPRPVTHYLEVLEKRTGSLLAGVEALNDQPLLPEGLDTVDPEVERKRAAAAPAGLKEDAQFRRAQVDIQMARDDVRRRGQDPDALGLKMPVREKPPSPAELPAYLERLREEMKRQQLAALEEAVGQAERCLELVRQARRMPHQVPLVKRGPPKRQVNERLSEMRRIYAKAAAPFDVRAARAQLEVEQALQDGQYLQSAHLQPPAARLTGTHAREARAELVWLLKRGLRKWPLIDLTGADLSNADLRGIDFTGAWLENADLRRARLDGARFDAAVLAHADLRGAQATKASFRGANLGRAQLADALLDGADLSGAVLQHTSFAGARLQGALLEKVQLVDTRWGPADFQGVVASGLLFHKLDLRGVVLAEAQLASCTFVECDLREVDFRAADLASATFSQCNAEGANFQRARLPGAAFVEATRLAEARFDHAQLRGANLFGCSLVRASFVNANLDGCNLMAADIAGADLRNCSAIGAMLRKASLQGTIAIGANLKDAVLQRADLRAADLRLSNLYGADLSRVQLDSATKLDSALLERARIWPRAKQDTTT